MTTEQFAAARSADQYWVCVTCGADSGTTSGCEECEEWVQEMIHYGLLPHPDEEPTTAPPAEREEEG